MRNDEADRLHGFVELALASASSISSGESRESFFMAANAALALAECDAGDVRRLRLRSALLYELADKPMMSAAVVGEVGGPRILDEYFKRQGPFASLAAELGDEASHNGMPSGAPLLGALGQQAWELAAYALGAGDVPDSHTTAQLRNVALHFGLDLNASDIDAFHAATIARTRLATRGHVPEDLFDDLATGGFPPELWSGQAVALRSGLLDDTFDAWSFSAPTGTGKTFLSRLLILATLRASQGKKAIYIVPSRALVRQVTQDLAKSLGDIGIEVLSVTPQLVALDDGEDESLQQADVLVLTPEKADLLIRIKATVMDEVCLVIIDEAHHIENGTRGVLLELYLWRLKQLAGGQARFVFMSAVAPNVDTLADWMGHRPGGVSVSNRSTGMRVGVYEFRKRGRATQGWIRYTDGTDLCAIEAKADRTQVRGIPQLAAVLGATGPVLVVAKGKKTAENLAEAFVRALPGDADCRLDNEALESPVIQRLDSRLEREMYAHVPLRNFLKAGVAYHHAGLPPRVREAVEAAISARYIRYVFATTTLAEGVNFPFSSVIVQSLVVREAPGQASDWRIVTPRTFWNIAGRAGRAGYDYEGQVVLYGPSLNLDKVEAVLDPYLESNPAAIAPVRSALAEGILRLRDLVERRVLTIDRLESIALDEGVPASTKGFVNLLRVGVAHARASGLEPSASNFFDGTLAARELDALPDVRAFARTVVEQQAGVVDRYLDTPGSPNERFLAELGFSLDTLSSLKEYVETLEDWRFEQVLTGLPGGHLRARSLRYFFSAIMARMTEPEGSRLGGGFYADLVVEWCSGIPFSGFTGRMGSGRLEDLINLMYTRIQYLLPWALYAVDRFFEQDAPRRSFTYDGQVRQIAYLADAGVPDFSALRLFHAGFERADATRLSRAHQRDREAIATTDVLEWVAAQNDAALMAIVRGADHRRVDFDLVQTVRSLRGDE
ncbi:MAG TPA: DEAD/DEAH box helicase [Conexibacter sp.]